LGLYCQGAGPSLSFALSNLAALLLKTLVAHLAFDGIPFGSYCPGAGKISLGVTLLAFLDMKTDLIAFIECEDFEL
jgi:hypothetical protein